MNYFVYKTIVLCLEPSKNVKLLIALTIIILSPLYFISEFLRNIADLYYMTYIGAIYFGILAIAFSIFLVQLIFVFLFPDRKKMIALISIFIIFTLSIISLYKGHRPPVVRDIEIYSKKIPEHLSGYNIIHLADLHLGKLNRIDWLINLVEKINALSPNIIVITGDFVDLDIFEIDKYTERLSELKAQDGIYIVPGNHEYYVGIENLKLLEMKDNFHIMINESYQLNDYLLIIGLDDPTSARFNGEGPDIDKAMPEPNCDLFKVLLKHQPLNLREYAELDIDLILCGHTHMGQIPPMDLIVYFYYRYPYGLYEYNSTSIFVSSGTATWGPPMRLFSSSEIVSIRFYSSET